LKKEGEEMFKGVGTAIVTPFKNGRIDYSAYRNLVKWQLAEKIQAIVVAGTTGEGATLTDKEREKLTSITKEMCSDRAKVIVGTGTNDTEKTLHLSHLASKNGADAVLVVSPYYNKPTQKGLIEHYKYLSERLNIPLIIYNVPSRTGVNINPETVAYLADRCKNIIGIKEANTDVSQADEIIRLISRKDFYVWSGNDDRTIHLMSVGAAGVISVFSNISPENMVRLTGAMLDKNYELARKTHFENLELMKSLFIETNPVPIKAALWLMGKIKNELRLPMTGASRSTIETLRDLLAKKGWC
jgi:4-hydroxy-tetrahydrodipicolinate synthase